MSSTIDAEIEIEKGRASGWLGEDGTRRAAKEGVKGEANLPLGLRRFVN